MIELAVSETRRRSHMEDAMKPTPQKFGPFTVRAHVRDGRLTGRWFLDIPARLMPNGKRKRKIFDNEMQAIAAAKALESAFAAGRPVVPTVEKVEEVRQSLTFCQAVDQWTEVEKQRVRTRKKRQSSLETDLHRLKWAKAFFGEKEISSFIEDDLVDFQDYRLNLDGRSPFTVNSDIRSIRKVLKWAVKYEYLAELPVVEAIPEDLPEVDIPTPAEVEAILATLHPKARNVVWFLSETGCRSGEVFNLLWRNVDVVSGEVQIQSRADWTVKTRRSNRMIPIHGPLLDMLRSLPKQGPYVFPSPLNPLKPRTTIRKALAGAVARSKLMRKGRPIKVTPKTFRKAFATWKAQAMVPEIVVQALMGHAPGSAVTAQHYTQASETAKRSAMESQALFPVQTA